MLPFKRLNKGPEAFVDEESQLKYIVKTKFQGKLRVLPETFAHFYVSMALPSDSPLRESFNKALAKIIDADDWVEMKKLHMGCIP